MRTAIRIALGIVLIAAAARADQWDLPRTRTALSDNGRYCAVVIPAGDTLDLSHLDVHGRFQYPRDLSIHDSAVVVLYERGRDRVMRPIWHAVTPYRRAPMGVRVRDDGAWVVMLNEWGALGRGDHVVVILDSAGRLVRSLSLRDMLPEDKVASFRRTTSSLWWICGASFVPDSGEFEILTVSNGEMPGWSPSAMCDDYVRIRLSDGKVLSFVSRFDEIQASYEDSCYDQLYCPTVRYLCYLMNHPDSSVRLRLDSLALHGSPLDSLRQLYEGFRPQDVFQLAAALKYIGRDFRIVVQGVSGADLFLLVEAHDEIFDFALQDSFPVVVMLPDSSMAFPLAFGPETFREAILKGGKGMFDLGYRNLSFEGDNIMRSRPVGALSSVCTPESKIGGPTNVYVADISFGTRIYIDLSRPLKWKRP